MTIREITPTETTDYSMPEEVAEIVRGAYIHRPYRSQRDSIAGIVKMLEKIAPDLHQQIVVRKVLTPSPRGVTASIVFVDEAPSSHDHHHPQQRP